MITPDSPYEWRRKREHVSARPTELWVQGEHRVLAGAEILLEVPRSRSAKYGSASSFAFVGPMFEFSISTRTSAERMSPTQGQRMNPVSNAWA